MTGIESAASGLATALGNGAAQAPAAAKPELGDVARFEAALDPAPTQEVQPVAEAHPAKAADTPGDRILEGLSRLSSSHAQAMEEVQRSLGAVAPGEAPSTADLMRLQFTMTQISVQQDVTGKVAGRATESLEQLLRNQ